MEGAKLPGDVLENVSSGTQQTNTVNHSHDGRQGLVPAAAPVQARRSWPQTRKSVDEPQHQTSSARPQAQASSSKLEAHASRNKPQHQAPSSRPQASELGSNTQAQGAINRPQSQSSTNMPQHETVSSVEDLTNATNKEQAAASSSKRQGVPKNPAANDPQPAPAKFAASKPQLVLHVDNVAELSLPELRKMCDEAGAPAGKWSNKGHCVHKLLGMAPGEKSKKVAGKCVLQIGQKRVVGGKLEYWVDWADKTSEWTTVTAMVHQGEIFTNIQKALEEVASQLYADDEDELAGTS